MEVIAFVQEAVNKFIEYLLCSRHCARHLPVLCAGGIGNGHLVLKGPKQTF